MPSESVVLAVDVAAHGSDRAVVSVRGELDVATAELLDRRLADQLEQGRHHLVLDLSGVPFIDSSGLTIVIRTMNATRRTGGSLCLVAPTPPVHRVLELTGMSLTIPISPSVAEAPSR